MQVTQILSKCLDLICPVGKVLPSNLKPSPWESALGLEVLLSELLSLGMKMLSLAVVSEA